MSVSLRKQRDGSLRPYWYGEFIDTNHRRKILNVGKWQGTPPPCVLGTGEEDTGDAVFERSREKAENELAKFVEESKRKGHTEHLLERLIESKTGAAVEYVELAELSSKWLPESAGVTEGYRTGCNAIFTRFNTFMQDRSPKARFVYQITPEDADAFAAVIRAEFAPKSYRDHVRLLGQAFNKVLPSGAVNPFKSNGGKHEKTVGSVHRTPFTENELQKIFDSAMHDPFMYPLIVCAASTGMRRGDVCNLSWSSVDLEGRMLWVKTSKTKEDVEIPIFPRLYDVLNGRVGNGSPFVFPEAAKMLQDNPDGLTWRFKKIVAEALTTNPAARRLPPPPTKEIESDAVDAVMAGLPEGNRREWILDVLRRYCAGASLSTISAATGISKGCLSNYLHTVEKLAGRSIIRSREGDVKTAIRALTQAKREQGQRAASVWDWHTMRTTWVTLALSAGVPIELVRKVTGHASAETAIKYYFRPNREQFKAAFNSAMPAVLTGGATIQATPKNELAAIAQQIAAGTATDADMKRFKKLAAKI